jgi:CPA2 family monovalent cation:H+ antiporter-2
MFGVGLHFSLKDLLSVRPSPFRAPSCRSPSRPLMGMGLAWAWAGPRGRRLVFGLALSVASPWCCCARCRNAHLETERGRIAVGWLIVEDLAMVLALVLLPALAACSGGEGSAAAAESCCRSIGRSLITLGKVTAFVGFMLVVGRRVIPWLLHWVAHTGSRELFRLAVLAIALGVAFGAAAVRRVLRAGRLLRRHDPGESELSHRAAEGIAAAARCLCGAVLRLGRHAVRPDLILLRSAGRPRTVLIIVVGKSLAAFLIVRAFRHPTGTALTDLGEPGADRRILLHPDSI